MLVPDGDSHDNMVEKPWPEFEAGAALYTQHVLCVLPEREEHWLLALC